MLMLHWVRELLVRPRTMLATALRAHLAEFGIATFNYSGRRCAMWLAIW